MKEYKTKVTTFVDAYISSDNIVSIIEQEMNKVLGGSDRFIKDGFIEEEDYRFNGSETIRKATEEEIELYESLWRVYKYFKNL